MRSHYYNTYYPWETSLNIYSFSIQYFAEHTLTEIVIRLTVTIIFEFFNFSVKDVSTLSNTEQDSFMKQNKNSCAKFEALLNRESHKGVLNRRSTNRTHMPIQKDANISNSLTVLVCFLHNSVIERDSQWGMINFFNSKPLERVADNVFVVIIAWKCSLILERGLVDSYLIDFCQSSLNYCLLIWVFFSSIRMLRDMPTEVYYTRANTLPLQEVWMVNDVYGKIKGMKID